MPDLLDDLRRYGDAVEAAALERARPEYVDDTVARHPGHRVNRKLLTCAVAAAVIAVIAVSLALVLGDDDHDSVRVDRPPEPMTVDHPRADPIQPIVLPPSEAAWTAHDPGPLTPRFGQVTVWTGKELVVWGGTNWDNLGDEKLADGATYDPASGIWSPMPPAPLTGRSGSVAVWTGSEVLIWGDGDGFEMDGAAYEPNTRAWRILAPSPLPQGLQYSQAWTGEELVVLGAESTTPQAAAYHPETDSWRQLSPPQIVITEHAPRFEMTWTGARLVAVGQLGLADPTQVLVYDPTTDQWSSVRPPDERIRPLAVTSYDGKAWIYGQSPNPNVRGLQSFEPIGGAWSPLVTLDDLGCEGGQQLTSLEDQIFGTGCGRAGLFDPVAATWTPMEAAAPGPPGYLTTNSHGLLWYSPDFARFDETGERRMGFWSLTP